MGGGHHAKHPPIPDWRIYKVENANHELVTLEKALARQGYKNPWMRNEVWRYPTFLGRNRFKYVFWDTCGRGMKWGFLAALITAAIHYSVDDYRVPRVFASGKKFEPKPSHH